MMERQTIHPVDQALYLLDLSLTDFHDEPAARRQRGGGKWEERPEHLQAVRPAEQRGGRLEVHDLARQRRSIPFGHVRKVRDDEIERASGVPEQ